MRSEASAGPGRQRRGAVLFDIDGTLVDNSYLHTVAWWRACRDVGVDAPMAKLHRMIGMGSDQFIDKLIGGPSEELANAHSRHIGPLFDEMVAFDGSRELLDAVARLELLPVLASSARAAEVDRLAEIIGVDTRCLEVVSSGDVEASKPAPDIFARALERAGVPAERAVAIGDTAWDVESAARAGIRCVAVTSGGWSEEELVHAGASAVYESVRDLLDRLPTGPIMDLAR